RVRLSALFTSRPAPRLPSRLSLHDALPISDDPEHPGAQVVLTGKPVYDPDTSVVPPFAAVPSEWVEWGPGECTEKDADEENIRRSEEHKSELQSREKLVCRLLLEKKNCDHT